MAVWSVKKKARRLGGELKGNSKRDRVGRIEREVVGVKGKIEERQRGSRSSMLVS
jgi:hypothetical protein